MALKADRRFLDGDISYFMNSAAERGGVVSFASTTASGVAMDQAANTVSYAANPSGVVPVGVLITEVVNLDLTRQHMNFHKEEVQVGGKVNVWTKGTVVTDMIEAGQTPTPGTTAWVGHSGLFSASDVASDDVATNAPKRVVGVFETAKNEDGFARVSVNLPNANS